MKLQYIQSIDRWKGRNGGLYGDVAAQRREDFDFKFFIRFQPVTNKVSSVDCSHVCRKGAPAGVVEPTGRPEGGPEFYLV